MPDDQIIFKADAWEETIDPDTGLKQFRAVPADDPRCQILLTVSAEDGGVVYTPSCRSNGCPGECNLEEVTQPNGSTIRRCVCNA